jgi:hypothetical protein
MHVTHLNLPMGLGSQSADRQSTADRPRPHRPDAGVAGRPYQHPCTVRPAPRGDAGPAAGPGSGLGGRTSPGTGGRGGRREDEGAAEAGGGGAGRGGGVLPWAGYAGRTVEPAPEMAPDGWAGQHVTAGRGFGPPTAIPTASPNADTRHATAPAHRVAAGNNRLQPRRRPATRRQRSAGRRADGGWAGAANGAGRAVFIRAAARVEWRGGWRRRVGRDRR